MKLGSLRAGGRDGTLVVVDTELTKCVAVPEIAPTLQAALDDWGATRTRLAEVSAQLNAGDIDGQPFDADAMHSPLPRAYQWADGSAFLNHVELVRRARGADMPESFLTDPLMYQGGSDTFYAPTDAIALADEAWGIDLEGEIAAITDDVPMGVTPDAAADHIQLLMLVNDVSLRNLIPNELAKGFGFFQGKASTAFSPVAVTPDELDGVWHGGTIYLPLLTTLNGEAFGRANAGIDMNFSLPELIAHAAKSRRLSAGTIIGTGTISNKLDGGPGKPVSEGGAGYSCIAEVRVVEKILHGDIKTPFLSFGDRVTVEMCDESGRSIFGKIDQTVEKYEP